MKSYTFHNRGTSTSFTPNKITTGADGNRITMLEFHQELVREAGRRDVYIMDHKGREVDCVIIAPLKRAA